MARTLSREDLNSMKGTSELQDPSNNTSELNEKYARTDEKFSQLSSQKEQVLTEAVFASSSVYSNNLVEDLRQKLKELNEVCQKRMELQKSLMVVLSEFQQDYSRMNALMNELRLENEKLKSQLAAEREKAQLTFVEVAESQEQADKNEALEEDRKRQFSELLHTSNSLKEAKEKNTQLEEERAAIIEKELATLKDSLAAKVEELAFKDRRTSSLTDATETLQSEMRSLKQQIDNYKDETGPQRALQLNEATKTVAGNCSTSSSIIDITAEYNFKVARPKSSTNLRTTTTDVEVHSLHAAEKSMLRPIAVGATNERPGAARSYGRKIRAREPEAEAIAPSLKKSKTIEPAELYRCHDCGKTYRQYQSISVHIKEDCGKPSVECGHCRIIFQPFSYRIHAKIGICGDARRRNITMKNLKNILHMLQEKIVASREVLRIDEFILLLRTHTCSIDHEHLASFFRKLHCFQKKHEVKRELGN